MANPWLLTHLKAELVCMCLPLWSWITWGWGGHAVRRVLHNPKPRLGEKASSHWLLLLLLKLGSLRPSCALDPNPFPLQEQNAWTATATSQLWTLKQNLNRSFYIFQSRHAWIKKLTLSSFSSSSVTSPSTSSKAALHG